MEQELGNGWAEGVHSDDWNTVSKFTEIPSTLANRSRWNIAYDDMTVNIDGSWIVERHDLPTMARSSVTSAHALTSPSGSRRSGSTSFSTWNGTSGTRCLDGRTGSVAGPQVNNPIGAMVTNANAGQRLIARGKVEIQELNDLLADIVADGHRAREVIQGIRNMMRKSEGSRSLVQITEVIQDLLRIVRADAFERKVAISTEIDSTTGCVLANRVQLLQVLLNLTMNGFEAMTVIRPDARRLVICARRNGDGEILVSVRDTGPGFPAGMVDQFFEPFFRQKPREPEWDLPLRAASSRRMADRSREKIVTARARVYGSAGSKEDKSGAP